ncbi:hypothetical protein Tsubulata_043598 [Turnera subulata]|uniref:Pectinesterase n=1 Tax=Turnera subulata TaxID=218843 RepID=A0A9Q0J5T2_9ROSI|nr:hypothetical protein Tsubulata_043598 [Turnera subulata]
MEKISHATPRSKLIFLSVSVIMKIFLSSLSANANPAPTQFSRLVRSAPGAISSNLCKGTPYKAACESVLLSLETNYKDNSNALPKTPKDLFGHSVQFTLGHAHSALDLASIILSQRGAAATTTTTNHLVAAGGGLHDCMELLEDTLDQLSNVVMNRKNNPATTKTHPQDVHTWLSAALTNQETCLESLDQSTKFEPEYRGIMGTMARNLSQHISNSLSLFVSNFQGGSSSSTSSGNKNNNGRKLLWDWDSGSNKDFPGWVSLSERKLLEASTGEIEMKAHAVVAKDGSGTHKTIGEAIRAVLGGGGAATTLAAGGGGGKNVIYIKAGTYKETLKFPTKQKNVMLVGDGKGKTIITASKNAEDGSTTYDSATVGVMGDGFMARDITFENSAGPNKHQAVALRVGSDRAVIFRCSILGYQDTLYTLSKRQFYRDTDIYGTVDFIFGNSAVVLQNCNINARSYGERNFVTAQGRTSPEQNTGISIHNCRINAGSVTYLGRPWKQYSRTVFMQSALAGSIHPSGWYPWAGGNNPKSVYYGEYQNSGPGASTSGRVKWPGYHPVLTSSEAQGFTVGGLIAGNQWLPSTGVSYDSGLIG